MSPKDVVRQLDRELETRASHSFLTMYVVDVCPSPSRSHDDTGIDGGWDGTTSIGVEVKSTVGRL